jgi:hypothetical protein
MAARVIEVGRHHSAKRPLWKTEAELLSDHPPLAHPQLVHLDVMAAIARGTGMSDTPAK